MAYVYRHIRLDKNEPFYIGIGSSKYYNRAYRHKNRSDFWKRVANKGGYEVEILMDDLTWEQACEKEKEFIKLYGRVDLKTGCLVNMTDGGDGALNAIISEKTRKSVAEANRRRVFTDEDRKKISIRHTGRKKSEESRKKLSNSLKNSEKFKEAIKINAEKYKGFKHSEKSKINMAKAKARPIYQKTIDGEIIKKWDSAKQVQRELAFSQGNISRCCNGDYSQAYGFKWEYYKQ
jgi:uncharacterized protein involved in tellurium resistance